MDIENGSINYSSNGYFAGKFYLPHSCDEWVIGDIKAAEQFAQDLLKTIEQVKASSPQ